MHGSSNGDTSPKDLLAYYRAVRNHTESLCLPLEIEDYIPQPIPDVSPAKWNIAHTTWFFEEMVLKRTLPDYKPFNEDFGYLFNSYYNTLGDRTSRDRRGDLSRPTVAEVFAYRRHVDEQMALLLRGDHEASSELIVLGLNHEQQHQELLLTDLKYTLGSNPIFPPYCKDYSPENDEETTPAGYIEIDGGIYEIGFEGTSFCFDNELGRHKQYLNDFKISGRLVTNAEFLEFMTDGSYSEHRLWHSEGWDWVKQNAIASPLYWHEKDGEWFCYTLGGLEKLSPAAPVCHVSFYEASAYAEWKGMRLPTEFEWEVASSHLDWGKRWEWTHSAYLPYPGFKTAAGAIGEYNGKFMLNQMVLRGSSVATPADHSRPTYRNFFHPHLRWQFTGIRLAK